MPRAVSNIRSCAPPYSIRDASVCVMPVVCERNGDSVSESVPKQRKCVSDASVCAGFWRVDRQHSIASLTGN